MINGRGVLWEVLRPIVAWPLRSRIRLVMVVAGAFLLVVILGRTTGADETPATADPAPDATAASTAAPAPENEAALGVPPAPAEPVLGSAVGLVETTDEEATGPLAPPAPTPEEENDPDPRMAGPMDHGDHDPSWQTLAPGESAAYEPRDEVETAIAERGLAAVQAMARPSRSISEQEWWEAFSAHLNSQARVDYDAVDPQQVPWSEVEDTALMLPSEDHAGLVRMVEIQTDGGPVIAHVRREGQEEWAVSRISWDWEPARTPTEE